MRSPRPYQTDCFNAIIAGFDRGLRGLCIEAFTGFGKGYLIALLCEHIRKQGGRVLVLVNRDNLVNQLTQSIYEQGLYPAVERSQDVASSLSDIVVGSVQTMQGKRLKKWNPETFNLVICDEVHFSAARTHKNVLDYFSQSRHVGMSATLTRHDKKALWKGYEEIVFSMPLQEGIDEGWLTPFLFQQLPVPIEVPQTLANKRTWKEEDEESLLQTYLHSIFGESASLVDGRKALFFWPGVTPSKEANSFFQKSNIASRHIDGYMSKTKRGEILDWFRETETGVLHNSDLLSYGYDNKTIDCIGIMRLGRSLPLLLQRLGRGTRVLPTVDGAGGRDERHRIIGGSKKAHCLVIDLMLQLDGIKHRFAQVSDLVTGDKEEREWLRRERAKLNNDNLSLDDLENLCKKRRLDNEQKQLQKLSW